MEPDLLSLSKEENTPEQETTEDREGIEIFPDLKNPLEVKLQIFEGPLDLLLHLIRKKQLDIYEIPLSELTASYLAYIEWMESINLDLAGEFLEIAATLIWIKSNHLLPKPQKDDDPNEENPEEVLRQRLIEYQQFKEAAFELSSMDLLGRDVFTHPAEDDDYEASPEPEEAEYVFEDLSLVTLMDAFKKLMERRPKVIKSHVVASEEYRIEDRMEEMVGLFMLQEEYAFEDFFEASSLTKPMMVITFMAILEMVKLKFIQVKQETLFESILCVTHPDFEKNLTQWHESRGKLL